MFKLTADTHTHSHALSHIHTRNGGKYTAKLAAPCIAYNILGELSCLTWVK